MTPHHSLLALLAALAGLTGLAAFSLWPSRINQFFFFGRTLPREFVREPVAIEITQRYSRQIVTGLGAGLSCFAALRILAGLPIQVCFILICVLEVVVFHVAFARAHRDAGIAFDGRRGARVTDETSDAAQRIVSVPLLGAKVPARTRLSAMMLPTVTAGAAWLAAMAASHMSFSALANAASENGGSGLLGFGLGVLCAGTLFSLLVRYSARYRTPMAQCMLRTMLLLAWVGALAIAGAAIAVPMHLVITHTMTRAVIYPVFALAMAHMIYNRGRMNQFAPPPVEQNGDEFWRWGLFYGNPADPALFVQARTGPGYTLNFGKLLAWPIAAAVFGYVVFLVFLGFHHS
jgi:hypothetical protein